MVLHSSFTTLQNSYPVDLLRGEGLWKTYYNWISTEECRVIHILFNKTPQVFNSEFFHPQCVRGLCVALLLCDNTLKKNINAPLFHKAMRKIVKLKELFILGMATSLGEFKTREILSRMIWGTLIHHSYVISLLKK